MNKSIKTSKAIFTYAFDTSDLASLALLLSDAPPSGQVAQPRTRIGQASPVFLLFDFQQPRPSALEYSCTIALSKGPDR